VAAEPEPPAPPATEPPAPETGVAAPGLVSSNPFDTGFGGASSPSIAEGNAGAPGLEGGLSDPFGNALVAPAASPRPDPGAGLLDQGTSSTLDSDPGGPPAVDSGPGVGDTDLGEFGTGEVAAGER